MKKRVYSGKIGVLDHVIVGNQRIRSTLADGCYWLYEYDSLGQVRSARKYWPDQVPVAGRQFQYTFDDIGNRTPATARGDQNGAGYWPAKYRSDGEFNTLRLGLEMCARTPSFSPQGREFPGPAEPV